MKFFSTFFLYILFSFTYFSNLANAAKLDRVVVLSPTRVIFVFDELPAYKSRLIKEANQVKLNFDFANQSENVKVEGKSNNEFFTNINVSGEMGNLEANIDLVGKIGFTASPLYYSNSVMVDFFDWSKIDKAEDDFRQGLFAIESGNTQIARDNFSNSIKSNNPNAYTYLGLLEFKDENFAEAERYMLLAEKNSGNIPDVYGVLSEIYSNDNPEKSEKYLLKYNRLLIPQIDFPESSEKEIELADSSLTSKQKSDSINVAEPDSLSFADNMENYLMPTAYALMGIAGLAFLVLVYRFITAKPKIPTKKLKPENFDERLNEAREKRHQKNTRTEENLPKSDDKLKENSSNNATKNQKEKPKGTLLDKKDDERKVAAYAKANQKSRVKKLDEIPTIPEIETKSNVEVETPAKKIEDFLQSFMANKDKEKEKPLESILKDMDIEKETGGVHQNAQSELAIHLAEEQLKRKKKNLDSLSNSPLPDSEEDAMQMAKDLGLESGAIMTKSNVARFESDEKLKSKLGKKFSVDNPNDNNQQ